MPELVDAAREEVAGPLPHLLAEPSMVQKLRFGLDSGVANPALRPLIGTDSVFMADGDEHLRRRKLVLPPFHGERMRAYEDVIRERAAAQASTWPTGVEAPLCPGCRG